MATRLKITDKLAGSVQWRGKGYFIWDTEVETFGVRVWGPKPHQRAYVVQVKHDGRQFREALGKVGEIGAAKAREAAIAFRGEVRKGNDPRASEKAAKGAWTLDDAMAYFRGTHAVARKLSDSHQTDSEARYRNHTPDRWRRMKLSSITQGMVALRHQEISVGQPTTANRWLALMSKLFMLGITHGHCTTNPARGIKHNPEEVRDRYLTPREIATLWTYLEKHQNVEAASCVQFILLTGCRPVEAFTARWSDIDMPVGIWTKPARRTKQRKRHVVALNARAVAAVRRLRTHERSEYVFPSPSDATKPRDDKLRAFWLGVRKHCGLPDVWLYDCRHSFASWLAMGGASALEIGAQLGHANVTTTQRYVHIAAEQLRARASIMDNVITKALEVHLEDRQEDQQPIVAERVSAEIVVTEGRTFSEHDLK